MQTINLLFKYLLTPFINQNAKVQKTCIKTEYFNILSPFIFFRLARKASIVWIIKRKVLTLQPNLKPRDVETNVFEKMESRMVTIISNNSDYTLSISI